MKATGAWNMHGMLPVPPMQVMLPVQRGACSYTQQCCNSDPNTRTTAILPLTLTLSLTLCLTLALALTHGGLFDVVGIQ